MSYMSLFYGCEEEEKLSQNQVTEMMKTELDKHDQTHKHRTIFDLNVTRAKLVGPDLLTGHLKDDQRLTHSILPCVPLTGSFPNIDRTSAHHFLYQGKLKISVIFASVPRFMFCDISVFVVVERIFVKPPGDQIETIMTNDDGNWDKFIGYRAGMDNTLSVGGVHGNRPKNCTIPAKFIGTKYLLSAHWLTGFNTSHIRINGEVIRGSSFTANINQIGRPYLQVGVFSLHDRKKFYSDIKFYGMRIVERHPSVAEVEEICDSMMAEHGWVEVKNEA